MKTPETLSPSPEIREGYKGIGEMSSDPERCLQIIEEGWMTDKQVPKLTAVIRDALRAARTTTQAPEIRYQLRNWHHVTCAGFGGQACTCLEQREALIAELVK